jgi:histidine triad (HIT) family protein
MDDCIFCKIIRGEIRSVKVYEDDDVLAFLDISQVTPGHTLLVPKKHVPDIYAYDTDLATRVFQHVPQIARAIKAAFPEAQGLNICNNNGELAYQSVFHSHIHFVPRYTTADGFSMKWANNADQYTPEKLAKIAEQIKAQIKEA